MISYLINRNNFNLIILLISYLIFVLGLNYPIFASEPLLTEIQFEKTSDAEEKVIFLLTGFYPPEVFALEGKKPRVVCDFLNTQPGKNVNRLIEAHGNFIQNIRVGIHPSTTPKVRVVLDLVPNQSYDIQQIFSQKENTFVLIVRLAQAETEKAGVPPER